VEFVSTKSGEYKKELVDFVKNKLTELPRGKISSTLRRLKKLGIIEESTHETTGSKIISKGRYWNSHIKQGG
jgi:predicted transcriptional regulator